MTASSIYCRLLHTARGLLAATGANVTVTFALAIIPVVGFVGAAVDYSQANSVKAALQAAADSTALMVSKEASSLNKNQIQSKANAYFKALFTRPEASGLEVAATYTIDDGSMVKINASTDVKTNFMGLMGFDKLKVAVESQVRWGNSRLRVALALDVTGSMKNDGKMTALKTATKSLLSQLKSAASKDGDVYVSIVPFNKDVNVGKSNYNEPWVSFADHPSYSGWDSENGKNVTTETCTESDGKGKGKGKGKGGKDEDCEKTTEWVPADRKTWNGCVTDRDQNHDINNTSPTPSNEATLFPAEQYSACPTELRALTYDWNALDSTVNALSPNGMTNQVIGLAWAFQSLTAYPLVIPPKDPQYKYSEILVLMSDGLNTQSRYHKSSSSIDERQKLLCENIKSAGITIYAVQVNTEGDPTQKVMKDCASDPGKFFEIKSANQLVSTFNAIGTNLSNLRVAK